MARKLNKNKKNGKLPGSAFRDKIYAHLKTQFRKVNIEHSLKCTTADIYYEDDSSRFVTTRVAIEAKDWGRSLNSADLAEIYNKYLPSFHKEIDHLIVVGNFDLGQGPSATAENLEFMEHLSYEKFVVSLMNFSERFLENKAEWDLDESSKNYLPLHEASSGKSLTEVAEQWLGSSEEVLLVYGGYGVGKTTFSKYYQSILTEKFESGHLDRIPIRVSLGSLYSRQDTRSLICSELQGREGGGNVKNFLYTTFLQLVRDGHVLLILDGFDEMRHAMDVESFRDTFLDMACLFQGRSKVILLGRPDSFFSEHEEDQVFQPLLEDGVVFKKCEIGMLSPNQVDHYISNYINTKKNGKGKQKYQDLKKYIMENELDVVSRPVQLSMFCKVMDRFIGNVDNFSRKSLYKNFIYQFIKRENLKDSRKIKDSGEVELGFDDVRSVFMQNIAWWLLTDKKENRFSGAEIPDAFVPTVVRGSSNSREGAVKEILLGSVIEPKSKMDSDGAVGYKNRIYYFPHKSYIEFLCAEYVSRVPMTSEVAHQFFNNVNFEIVSFLNEGDSEIKGKLAAGLKVLRASVVPLYIMNFISDSKYFEFSFVENNIKNLDIQEIFLVYISMLRSGFNEERVIKLFSQSLLSRRSVSKVGACISIAAHHIGNKKCNNLLSHVVNFLVEVVGIHGLEKISKLATLGSMSETTVCMAALAETLKIRSGVCVVDVIDLKRVGKWASRRGLYVEGLDELPEESLRFYPLPRTNEKLNRYVDEAIKRSSPSRVENVFRVRYEDDFESILQF